jgi:hypothetical protein
VENVEEKPHCGKNQGSHNLPATAFSQQIQTIVKKLFATHNAGDRFMGSVVVLTCHCGLGHHERSVRRIRSFLGGETTDSGEKPLRGLQTWRWLRTGNTQI